MRQSINAVLSAVALLIILVLIKFSFGRQTIPDIAGFFSERDGVWQNVRQTEYPEREILHTLGLRDSVTIVRDDRGVPHIFANNKYDAQVALGYVTAQDRFFQLFFNPRIVAGQLSKWMGDSYTKVDKAFLNLGLEKAAWRYHNSMSDQEYEMVNAYKRGINNYLNRYGNSNKPLESKIKPIEYRYWRPVDCARVWKYWEFLLSYGYDDPLNQYLINTSSEEINALLFPNSKGQQPEDYSSDAMALYNHLSAQHNTRERVLNNQNFDVRGSIVTGSSVATNSQNAIMAADMHLPYSLPSHLYEVHIITPESNIHGVTFPGIPVVLSGFNNKFSWSVTPYNNDLVDFIDITKADVGDTYSYGGSKSFHSITNQTYSINTLEGKKVKHTVQFSDQGVLINTSNQAYEMNWAAHSSSAGTMLNYWKLNNAESSESAINFGTSFTSPTMKLVFADKDGKVHSISPDKYLNVDRTAGISVQPSKMNSQPYSGFWQIRSHKGIKGFSELDVLERENRTSGNLANPLHPWKAKRLKEIGSNTENLNIDTAIDIQQDVKLAHQLLTPYILETVSKSNDQQLNVLGENLQDWDFRATVNSGLPIFWDNFLRILRRNIWDELPDKAQPSDRFWLSQIEKNPDHPIFDTVTTQEDEDFQDLVDKSVKEALEMSIIEHGNQSSWSWATSTIIRPFHISGSSDFDELVNYPFKRNGFSGTINEIKKRNVPFGPVWRMVVDYSRQPTKGYVMTRGGVSGNPFSRYYNTGVSDFNSNGYVEVANIDSPEEMKDKISTKVMAPVN